MIRDYPVASSNSHVPSFSVAFIKLCLRSNACKQVFSHGYSEFRSWLEVAWFPFYDSQTLGSKRQAVTISHNLCKNFFLQGPEST